jgi:acetyl-CoA acyltransferase
MTVPQQHSFYGAPWLATMLGMPRIGGPTFAQACATSARTIAEAAMSVECSVNQAVLCVTADRVSNGPHIYYPNPLAPGGRGTTEEWTWDNFNCDPALGIAMIETAENVARENGITREEQDAVTLERYEQYAMALANDRAFQRRYMLDVEVPDPSGKRVTGVVAGDRCSRAAPLRTAARHTRPTPTAV